MTVDHAGIATAIGAASSAVLAAGALEEAADDDASTGETTTAEVDAEPHAAASSNGKTVAAPHRMATTLARGQAREKEKRETPMVRVLTVGNRAESFAPPTSKNRIVALSRSAVGLGPRADALLLGVAMADAEADPKAQQEPAADGERDEQCGQRSGDPLRDQLIVKLLPALTAPPANGGMCAARNLPAMHPPTGVPGKGPWSTTAEETEPFGANVIVT